jgi:hypothetical protein
LRCRSPYGGSALMVNLAAAGLLPGVSALTVTDALVRQRWPGRWHEDPHRGGAGT